VIDTRQGLHRVRIYWGGQDTPQSRAYQLVFQKKLKGLSSSLIADMAQRKGGLAAIAAGLGIFYYVEGDWAELGSGAKSHLPLGYVFPIQATRYELNHYNRSKCPDDDSE
jgi:hypothetical protein